MDTARAPAERSSAGTARMGASNETIKSSDNGADGGAGRNLWRFLIR